MPYTGITDGADAVLDNHVFVRNGSFWTCRNGCGTQVPFPSPIPGAATLGSCRPRRWGDPDDPIVRRCRRCDAGPGELCFDLRTVMARMDKRHKER